MTYRAYNYGTNEILLQINLEDLKKQIEESRRKLYSLMDLTTDFKDRNIIEQSQKLDQLLNNYEEIKFYNKDYNNKKKY